jgi:hypothetical protein
MDGLARDVAGVRSAYQASRYIDPPHPLMIAGAQTAEDVVSARFGMSLVRPDRWDETLRHG